MATIIDVLRGIRDAISGVSGGQDYGPVLEEIRDCICAQTDAHKPVQFPPPVSPDGTMPIIDSESWDEVEPDGTRSGSDICRSAIATARLQREMLQGLSELVDLGIISYSAVIGIIGIGTAGAAGGVFLRLTSAVIGFVVAAMMNVWSFFGWGSGDAIRGWMEQLHDDLFVCDWLLNLPADTEPTQGHIDAILAACQATVDGMPLPASARWMIRETLWSSKIWTLATWTGYDEEGEPIAWDLSHLPGTCSCDEDIDSVWIDFVQGVDCNHFRFAAWLAHSDNDNPIGQGRRIVQGIRCSDSASMQGPSLDGFLLDATQGGRIKQFFTAEEGDYFELEISYFTGVGVSSSFHVLLGETQIFSDNRQGVADSTTLTLENLSAGTHSIGFHKGTGTNQNIVHVAKLRKIAGP